MKKCLKKFIAMLEICSMIVTLLVSINVENFTEVEGKEETLDFTNFKYEECNADSQTHNIGNWEYWIYSQGTYQANIGVDQDNWDRILIKPTMSAWKYGYAICISKTFEGYKPYTKYEVSFDINNDADSQWTLAANCNGKETYADPNYKESYYEFKPTEERFTGEFIADEKGNLTIKLGFAYAQLDKNYIIDAGTFEIKETEADYIVEGKTIYDKVSGESVSLKPTIKMNGTAVEKPENEDYSFIWYCVTKEGEKEQISTSYECNIAVLSMKYFYYYENDTIGNTICCEVYKDNKKVGEAEYKIYEKEHDYSVEDSIDVLGKIGEELILTPIIYDNGSESDIYNDRYRYEWYQFKWESGEKILTSEILSDESVYKISSLGQDDISNYSDYRYMCKAYRGDRLIGDICFKIKEKSDLAYAVSQTYYVNEGDSVTLSTTLYDNENNVIENLEDKGYEFKWYCNEDGKNVELINKEISYTIESVKPEDISFERGRFSYWCGIYKNGKHITDAYFYLRDKTWGYSVVSTYYSVTVGQSYAIKPIIFDISDQWEDEEVEDMESLGVDFTWYKVENKGETKTQVSTDIYYIIESVSNGDIHADEDEENFNSTYYELVISKDGVEISEGCYYLVTEETEDVADADDWYCTENYQTIVEVGGECVLDISLYNKDYESIADYKEQGFEFEWYGYDENEDIDRTKILSTEKSYAFEVSEDIFSTEGTSRFACKITRGYKSDWVYFELVDAKTEIFARSPVYYGKEGDSLELTFTMSNYYGDEIEFDDSFSFEWRKYTYKDYNDEIIGNGNTYKIEQLVNNDFCDRDDYYNENVVHYECEIYRYGKTVGTCYFTICNEDEAYNIWGDTFYGVNIGDQIELKPSIVDHYWNVINPSEAGLTLKWYKILNIVDEVDEYLNTKEYLGEGESYLIASATEDDIISDTNHDAEYVCEIWRDSRRLGCADFYLYDTNETNYYYVCDNDAGMWYEVKEGDIYTLGDAKYGYYSDGKIYKPGAEIEVTRSMQFTPINELSVVMSYGAAVRTSTPAGLKFEAKINSDNIEAVQSEAITEGILITANDIYENNDSILDLTSAYKKLNITNSGWSDEQTMTYCGAVANITEQNYMRDFVAKAYVTISYEDGTATTVYSNISQKRNVNFVANEIRKAGYPELDANEISVINSFCGN